jgi:predicted enzyme related to lactoylglutathione lyase
MFNLKTKTMKKLVAWVEIPAVDFKRAVKFYNTILEMELQEIDCGVEKMACFPSGEGAISFAPGFNPSKDGVLVSLHTGNDLDNTMNKIVKNGGTIIQPKTKIQAENRGYFSIFIDCEGNKIGLYGDN